MRTNSDKGFTMIELIAVIAIIAILSAIAIPIHSNIQNKARQDADNYSVVSLNKASIAYAMTNEVEIPDIFHGIDTNEARMQKLVDENFLYREVEAQQKDAEFDWVVDKQLWVISGAEDGETGEETPDPGEVGEPEEPEYPGWDAKDIYSKGGNYVTYNGKLYYNLWWVDGNTLPGTDQVWQEVSDSWVYYNIYNAGDTVIYNGKTYKAKYWTSGDKPNNGKNGPWEMLK